MEELPEAVQKIINNGNKRLLQRTADLAGQLIKPEISIGLKLDPDLLNLFNMGMRADAINMQTLREIQLLNSNTAKFFNEITKKYLNNDASNTGNNFPSNGG